MALIRGWRFLDSARINKIVRTLADELEAIGARNLVALNRTPVVAADDDEIIGKFKGKFNAADVIADDQAAVVYNSPVEFEFVTNVIPNLKHGSRIGQHMINRLARLKRNLGSQNDLRFFTDWENSVAEFLVLGIRQRMNALICAMWLDSSSYDRYGIKLTGGWGTPSGLKVAGSDWSIAGGTPITDLQVLMQETAPDTYGEDYNRITMSSKAFRAMTATTEFQNRVAGELRYSFSAGQLNVRDTGMMRQLAANILGAEIEIYDGVFYEVGNNGTRSQVRYIPNSKIVLSNSQDDNDSSVMDFANGIVTESITSELTGVGGIGGEAFGPIAYFTSDEDLNPPDIRAWAVSRGFPRKHRETATATIDVPELD